MPAHARSNGVVKLVSVLVSVWTLTPLKPLLHLQFRMEAEVGIGRYGAGAYFNGWFSGCWHVEK